MQRHSRPSPGNIYEFVKQEAGRQTGKIASRGTTQLELYYNRMSIIKNDVWQGENEWRLMWRSTTAAESQVYKCSIGREAITRIYVGMRCPPETAAKLVAAAQKDFPGAIILQAQKRHGELALEFHPLG